MRFVELIELELVRRCLLLQDQVLAFSLDRHKHIVAVCKSNDGKQTAPGASMDMSPLIWPRILSYEKTLLVAPSNDIIRHIIGPEAFMWVEPEARIVFSMTANWPHVAISSPRGTHDVFACPYHRLSRMVNGSPFDQVIWLWPELYVPMDYDYMLSVTPVFYLAEANVVITSDPNLEHQISWLVIAGTPKFYYPRHERLHNNIKRAIQEVLRYA